jgi:eukaryotic-like serine/threonine-protein kinase
MQPRPSCSADRNPVEKLAEEFAERYRRGERPSLTEYVERCPEHADEIRELFPALVVMEQLKPAGDRTGAYDAPAGPGVPPPKQLGDYRVVREVGRGGMGVVYEAVQVSLGRHVALKVLPAHGLLTATYLERFRREAKAAARLHHTNIVPVYGVGEADGVHYYAMQFIQGQGLDAVLHDLRRLRQQSGGAPAPATTGSTCGAVAHSLVTGEFAGPAPPDAAAAPASAGEPRPPSGLSGGQSESTYYRGVARIGLQVAEALAYAHKQGVLHRDVKPSNLLLDVQGTVWVTDFGLAKAEDADNLTHTGDIVGTVRYMAPERFEGRSLPQSDVYSLGLTLYELLALRPPFDHTIRARLIEQVLRQPPAPPSRFDRRIPRDLETVVLKCLTKDPRERYAGAEDLAEDLRRFLADRPIKARRSSLRERAWRWCRRNPAVAALGSAVALLLIVLGVGSVVAGLLRRERDRAVTERVRAEQAEAEARGLLGRARAAERENKVRELLAQAQALRRSGQAGQRFRSLRALEQALALGPPPALRAEVRNEVIAALALPDVEVAREWDGWPAGSFSLDFDSRFRRYVRTDVRGGATVRRVADDVELYSLSGLGAGDSWPRLSPDGRSLAVLVNGRVKLWRLAGPRPELLADVANAAWHDFSPDGRRFVVAQADGTLSVLDTPGGRRLRRLGGGAAVRGHVAFHPRGGPLALCSGESVLLRDLDSGGVVAELKHRAVVGHLAWHPGGKTLATADEGGTIYLWDVPARKVSRVLKGHLSGGVRLAFSPAGDLLVSSAWDSVLRLWDVRTGRQLVHTPALMVPPRFRADGRLLGAEIKGTKVRLLRLASGGEFRTPFPEPASGPESYRDLAVSPDGRFLAAVAETPPRRVEVLDWSAGRVVASQPLKEAMSVRFEPSGDLVSYDRLTGLLRWPARADPAAPGAWRVGPPRLVAQSHYGDIPGSSADGRTHALPWGGQYAVLVREDRPGRPTRLGPQRDVRFCAVSPDGRWAATGSHDSSSKSVRVWDTGDGRLAAELPVLGSSLVSFSPDGRWLATNGGGCRLWAVGSWEEGPSVRGAFPAFSPDGRLLAVGDGYGVVRLLDPASGAEYARLEAPVRARLFPRGFTPDGAHLFVTGDESRAVHVWDLRALREGLSARGLDWDLPPYPLAPPAPPPPRAEFVGGDLAADAHKLLRRERDARTFWLWLNPFDADASYRRAVLSRQLGDTASALKDLDRALALRPGHAEAAYERAWIHYRAGRWRKAADDFSRFLARHPADVDALHFRAHAHERLGEHRKAADDFTAALGREPANAHFLEARAACYLKLRQHERALADLERARAAGGDSALVCNNLAWLYATGPRRLRDPKKAVALAQRAAGLEPGNATARNTLGVALYRAGELKRAVRELEAAAPMQGGRGTAFDLFFLAMCHARLGEPGKAKECFDQAVRWCEGQKGLPPEHAEELKQFRAEAEAALRAR